MNLYLRASSIAIQKFDLYYLCSLPIQTFFWSSDCTIFVCNLWLLLQTILDLWPVLILEIFSCWDIKKGQFQFLVTFLAVFFWSVNCTNQVCISSHILNMGNILFEGFQYLVFQFLVFLSILSLVFVAILPVIYARSVNYTFILDMSKILDNIYT